MTTIAEDPHAILGIPAGAPPSAVRSAYLREVSAHPPDRDPEGFQRVRAAYEALTDPSRIVAALLAADPREPLERALDGVPNRRFAGPDLWLSILRRTPA